MASLHAFKFLRTGARARFSRTAWPQPSAQGPGAWVEAQGRLALCQHGIHACHAEHLPHWLDDELWHIELDGERLEGDTMVVARRGRLLARLTAYDALKPAFADFCIARARELAMRRPGPLAERYARDVEALWQRGQLASAAYVSALSARCTGELDEREAYANERRIQAAWLHERLG